MLRSTCYVVDGGEEYSLNLPQEYDMQLYHDYNHSTFKRIHSLLVRVSTANSLCPLYRVSKANTPRVCRWLEEAVDSFLLKVCPVLGTTSWRQVVGLPAFTDLEKGDGCSRKAVAV